MNTKLYSILLMVMAVCIIHVAAYSQQCAISRTGQNLCNSGQTSYLSNTSNTITIYEAGITPAAGTYNVTISYYDQSANACAPLITCSGTVSASGTTTTISLSGCSALPDLSASGIVYIDLQSAANSYFFHIYGGACMLPLPIDLTAFSLQRDGNTIKLMWTTAQESNASGVYIERNSVAGSGNFDMDIGFVPATNTSTPHSYTFIDQYPLNGTSTGTNIYRLRMVDLNGTVTYSKVLFSSCSGCTATPPQLDCSAYHIIGPYSSCEEAVTYSLTSPQIFYTTYTWSVNNYWYFPDQKIHLPYVTAKPSGPPGGDGLAILSVSISRCNSNTRVKGKEIESGRHTDGLIYVSGSASYYAHLLEYWQGTNNLPSDSYTVDITYPQEGTPVITYVGGNLYSWTWDPIFRELGFYLPYGGYAEFQMDIETDCGPKTYNFIFQATNYASYTISPNPASSQLNVRIDDRTLNKMNAQAAPDQNIQQVIVADKMGNTVMQHKYPAGTRNINLNIAGLKADMYTIRIFNGKNWTVQKFLKQ